MKGIRLARRVVGLILVAVGVSILIAVLAVAILLELGFSAGGMK